MKKFLPVVLRKQKVYRFKNQNDSILLKSSDNQKLNSGNDVESKKQFVGFLDLSEVHRN